MEFINKYFIVKMFDIIFTINQFFLISNCFKQSDETNNCYKGTNKSYIHLGIFQNKLMLF